MASKSFLIPSAATTPTLRDKQAHALSQHQAATAIERALRRAGLPYEVWIIAAEFGDKYQKKATALTAKLVAAHPQPEVSTCEPA